MTIDSFKREIAAAVKAYEKYVVCLDKTPEDFEASLKSLMQKAIKAYENRGEGFRHGIALDNRVTVILSQGDEAAPDVRDLFQPPFPLPEGRAAEDGEGRWQNAGERGDDHRSRTSSPTCASPVTMSATMLLLSSCGPLILTSPCFQSAAIKKKRLTRLPASGRWENSTPQTGRLDS